MCEIHESLRTQGAVQMLNCYYSCVHMCVCVCVCWGGWPCQDGTCVRSSNNTTLMQKDNLLMPLLEETERENFLSASSSTSLSLSLSLSYTHTHTHACTLTHMHTHIPRQLLTLSLSSTPHCSSLPLLSSHPCFTPF